MLTRGRPTAAQALLAASFALVLILAASSGVPLALKLLDPLPLDYGEGFCLERTLAVARGQPLYPPMDRPPYVAWPYTPLYVWVCAIGVRTLGPAYLPGRLVSALSILAAAVLIYLLAKRVHASRRWALAAALLFVGSLPVAVWGSLMRVDSLGMALQLGGLLAVATGASPVLAGILFALAILSKQSFLAALAAACLHLALSGRRRELAVLAGTCVPIVGAVCLWQMAATGGWFWHHVVTAIRNRWVWGQFAGLFVAGVGRSAALLCFAVMGRPRGAREDPVRLAYTYLAFAGAATLMAGKVGSDINYFLDTAAALAVVASVGMARMAAGTGARHPQRLLVPLLVAVHVACAMPPIDLRRAAEGTQAARVAIRALAATPGPVIAEEPGLAVAAGHAVWFQPFEYTQMAAAGFWDPVPLIDALRRGHIRLLVLRFDPWDPASRGDAGLWSMGRFSDAMVAAIRDGYRVRQRLGGMYILCPRRTGGQVVGWLGGRQASSQPPNHLTT